MLSVVRMFVVCMRTGFRWKHRKLCSVECPLLTEPVADRARCRCRRRHCCCCHSDTLHMLHWRMANSASNEIPGRKSTILFFLFCIVIGWLSYVRATTLTRQWHFRLHRLANITRNTQTIHPNSLRVIRTAKYFARLFQNELKIHSKFVAANEWDDVSSNIDLLQSMRDEMKYTMRRCSVYAGLLCIDVTMKCIS